MYKKLVMYKPPLEFNPCASVKEVINQSGYNSKLLNFDIDPVYFRGLLEGIVFQIRSIKKIKLTPVYVCLSCELYKLILVHNYNQSGCVSTNMIFGLIPIVSSKFDDYEFEVQCIAKDEMLYEDELYQIRHKGVR